MELKMKKDKRLTKAKLGCRVYELFRYSYDLGWIFGIGKDIVRFDIFGKLHIFEKIYNMKEKLGKDIDKIKLGELVKFIEEDPVVRGDIESNSVGYDILAKATKKYSRNKKKLTMFGISGVSMYGEKGPGLDWLDMNDGVFIFGYLGIWTKEDKGNVEEQIDKIVGIDISSFDRWWNIIMGSEKIMGIEINKDRTFELVDGNVLKLVGKDWGKGKGKEEFITGLSRYDKKYGCRVINFDELETMVNLMVG